MASDVVANNDENLVSNDQPYFEELSQDNQNFGFNDCVCGIVWNIIIWFVLFMWDIMYCCYLFLCCYETLCIVICFVLLMWDVIYVFVIRT